ncbi:MAG: MATE family efflux transporter [Lachnospiraceae bacterium]|nr:MATE family efflux transporter [Lachnospiraceae bacterium]
MEKTEKVQGIEQNPLGTAPVTSLLVKFAVPSIIAMLVSALYNIVDQLFIGNSIGELGNAATNIAFPLTTSCTAISLVFGIGGASCFNLAMGAGNRERAPHYIGNAAFLLFICGSVLCLVTETFLTPMLHFFGSPENVLPYAQTYTSITAIGFPFLILTTGGGHLIRADGSPRFAMICNLSGALINTVLDAVFIFGFHMGMAGAAFATITGQIFSAILVFRYLRHYRTASLKLVHLRLRWCYTGRVISLGMSPFCNQIAMMVVQIVMNKSLAYYGALSIYGESIPLACSGIINKVGMVFFSVVIGISQGLQPIASFNYGARKYDRVCRALRNALTGAGVISIIAFVMFQLFPRQISAAFGSGSEMYFQFAARYFRIYFFFIFINFVQPISSNFFTAIGKPYKGVFLSLTRQILFLLPLLLLFPLWMGIDGIMYAGPCADLLAAVIAISMTAFEIKKLKKL